jgi:DNA modification methylase
MEKNKRITWTIEKRKLKDLKPHSKNPREFTEKGMKDLENSINSIGFMQPININQDGTILSGHARAMKLQDIGEKEVDVYVPDRVLTPKQEEEVLIRANANTAGKWDWDLLANEWDIEELDDWGLEVPDLELGEEEPEIEEDEVPEVKKDPFVKRGDVWELNNHRLMCGDATMIDDVEKLMNSERADMVFTDPPYGVDYKGINNDDRGGLEDLLRTSFSNMMVSTEVGGSFYCFHSDRCADIFHKVYREFCHFSSMIIWVKESLVLSQTDYQSKHEPCLYGWFDNGTHKWFSDRKQESVWISKRESVDGHTTPKPLNIVAKAIANSSVKTNKVLDLFLGSGSTLLACEQTKRKCYGMELDEHYCSVIITRWLNYMIKEKKEIALKCNGEIINYKEVLDAK